MNYNASNIYKNNQKVETPLGVGFLIDLDPRGFHHVWFNPRNHDWFESDEIIYVKEDHVNIK